MSRHESHARFLPALVVALSLWTVTGCGVPRGTADHAGSGLAVGSPPAWVAKATPSATADPPPTASPVSTAPPMATARSSADALLCPGNAAQNGDFEEAEAGWTVQSTAAGPKSHRLIGSEADGFTPHHGRCAAKLGGYEGVADTMSQTVAIAPEGRLSYWWRVQSYENLPHHDRLVVQLLGADGTVIATLATYDDQDKQDSWQQDTVDVSGYAGQELTLSFSSYNDNYYFTTFYLDEVCLRTAD